MPFPYKMLTVISNLFISGFTNNFTGGDTMACGKYKPKKNVKKKAKKKKRR